jgi:hypothetical protein
MDYQTTSIRRCTNRLRNDLGTTTFTERCTAMTGDQREETAAFTPGPWTWSYCITDPYSLVGANGKTIIRPLDGVVYSEYSSDSATLELSSPDDAYLIAAAPSMYEALKTIVACGGNDSIIRETALAALRLARGLPPSDHQSRPDNSNEEASA